MTKLGDLVLMVMAVNMFLGVLLMCFIAHVAARDLDSIESCLKKSNLVINNRKLFGDSLVARMVRLMQISSCLGMRKFSVRKGLLDKSDVLNFPPNMARRIIWLGRLLFVVFAVMVLVGAYGKYFNGYEN